MGRIKTNFFDSLVTNRMSYDEYLDRLTELSISMFKWSGLPDTIDPRFLELTLFQDGQAVFFNDPDIGYLALQCMANGNWNVYRIPIRRRAYATNHYQKALTDKDSVIIYNNYLHKNSVRTIRLFARRLANLDRAIDVNANAQKTPVLVVCDDSQRLTMQNVYKEYDGNAPVIYGTAGFNPNSLSVLKTDAPYVCDKLYTLKTQIWNEALTYLGISNINVQKKERLITDEVTRNQGGTIASRYSRLEARRDASKQINSMFGLNIWCDYREDYQQIDDGDETTDGDSDKGGDNNE